MKPTETLKTEHRAILLMLKVAESVSRKLEAGERVPARDPARMVGFTPGVAARCPFRGNRPRLRRPSLPAHPQRGQHPLSDRRRPAFFPNPGRSGEGLRES